MIWKSFNNSGIKVEQYRSANDALHENILSMREEIECMKETFQQEVIIEVIEKLVRKIIFFQMDEQKWINFTLHIDNIDVNQTNQMYSEQVGLRVN